jgi:hypothetical protein
MNLLKLIKAFIGGCIVTFFLHPFGIYDRYIFYVVNASINNFEFKT